MNTLTREYVGYDSKKLLTLVNTYVGNWIKSQVEEDLYHTGETQLDGVSLVTLDSGDVGSSVYVIESGLIGTNVFIDVAPIYKKAFDCDLSIEKVVNFELNKVKKYLLNDSPITLVRLNNSAFIVR